MAQTRHRSAAVARRYIRDGSLFRGNAAAAVGRYPLTSRP